MDSNTDTGITLDDWPSWRRLVLKALDDNVTANEKVMRSVDRLSQRVVELERKIAITEAKLLVWAGVFAVVINVGIQIGLSLFTK